MGALDPSCLVHIRCLSHRRQKVLHLSYKNEFSSDSQLDSIKGLGPGKRSKPRPWRHPRAASRGVVHERFPGPRPLIESNCKSLANSFLKLRCKTFCRMCERQRVYTKHDGPSALEGPLLSHLPRTKPRAPPRLRSRSYGLRGSSLLSVVPH